MSSAVIKLIEKQKAAWEIQGRLDETHQRPGRIVEAGVSYGPCLLISRECGSGGNVISRMVGERLGWQVFDREVVEQISQLAHARQSFVESVDERIRSKWENTWRSMIDSEDIGSEQYLHYLHEVVMTLGHNGDVIILGRGAQYILPRQCALKVRLIAPLEQRAARLAEIRKTSPAEARVYVQQTDAGRARYVKKTFKGDIAAPSDYDLVINTGEMSFEQSGKIVLAALEHKLGVKPRAA